MLKNEIKSDMVVHAYGSSTWKIEERSGNLSLVSVTLWIWG